MGLFVDTAQPVKHKTGSKNAKNVERKAITKHIYIVVLKFMERQNHLSSKSHEPNILLILMQKE